MKNGKHSACKPSQTNNMGGNGDRIVENNGDRYQGYIMESNQEPDDGWNVVPNLGQCW